MRSDLPDPHGGTLRPLPPPSVLVFLPRPLRPFRSRAEEAARPAPPASAEAGGPPAGAPWRLSGTAGGGAPGPEDPTEDGLEDEEAFEEDEDDEADEPDTDEEDSAEDDGWEDDAEEDEPEDDAEEEEQDDSEPEGDELEQDPIP